MGSKTFIDTSYALRKWTSKEKQVVINLREKNHGPKKIADITGFPVDQIKFWLYGSRTKKRNKKKSKNHNQNSKKSYYRIKFNNWFSWKAHCYRASLLKQCITKEEVPSREDLEYFLINGNKVCEYCKKELHQENISLDHKIPVIRNGPSSLDNLALVCSDCNEAKGALTNIEYVKFLKCISTWEDGGKYLIGRLRAANRFYFKKFK